MADISCPTFRTEVTQVLSHIFNVNVFLFKVSEWNNFKDFFLFLVLSKIFISMVLLNLVGIINNGHYIKLLMTPEI